MKRKAYDARPIIKQNFNPMTHNLMTETWVDDHVQVYVDCVGGQGWINITREDFRLNYFVTDKNGQDHFFS